MNVIRHVFADVNAGFLDSAFNYKEKLNEQISNLLAIDNYDADMIEDLREAIIIGNATYNNSSSDILPIEDGVWDMLVEKYRKHTDNDAYPVGFKPTADISVAMNVEAPVQPRRLFSPITEEERDTFEKMVFREEIMSEKNQFDPKYIVHHLFSKCAGYIPKRLTNITHNHPDLVGTFDKCKFVLNKQAREKGVENDPSVRIMERDFFQPLLERGILDYGTEFTMIATLKYDGISVEADVCDRVLSARTRGDAVEAKATDLTPILGGYRFPRLKPGFNNFEPIGMKFEAIINNYNLTRLNLEKGYQYKNCRTAMTGIIGSSDAYLYRDLITLVPISTDIKDEDGKPLDRLVEIDFLNAHYTRDQLLRYAVFTGNYTSILFQIKKFVDDAEIARSYLPFMYDGVVIEFYDNDIREFLGRDHAIDRYKCAIKFNPLTKQTIFRGYYYTIGQDGTITPMITYDPVEFFGTIHPDSSGHSYQNFKTLDLHVGDIIDVTYRNDVITYVTKPDNAHNRSNANNPYTEKDSFPTHCPYCASKIKISKTGRQANCPNIACPEREIKRITASLKKLGVVNFGEETVRALGYRRLLQFFQADTEDFAILGKNNKAALKEQLDNIKNSEIYDYKLFGSIGFNSMAEQTWQMIFNKIHWKDGLVDGIIDGLLSQDNFPAIKNIGPATIKTIFDEWDYFYSDIMYLTFAFNIKSSYGMSPSKQIRFTGCRDSKLEKELASMGIDCDGNKGVTKSTDILLVPHEGYTSSKVENAIKHGIRIIPIGAFSANPYQYL